MEPETVYVGIDVSKSYVDVAVRPLRTCGPSQMTRLDPELVSRLKP